jgi:hypothetical protein
MTAQANTTPYIIDPSAVMKRAWAMARECVEGNESPREYLSLALRLAWHHEKGAVAAARAVDNHIRLGVAEKGRIVVPAGKTGSPHYGMPYGAVIDGYGKEFYQGGRMVRYCYYYA